MTKKERIEKAIEVIKSFNPGQPRNKDGEWTTGNTSLPRRTTDTMSEAIAIASPSGEMSKRAKKGAVERLRVSLFGEQGLKRPEPKQPSKKDALLQQAKRLRELAERGMKPRAYKKEAKRLEAEAAKL